LKVLDLLPYLQHNEQMNNRCNGWL